MQSFNVDSSHLSDFGSFTCVAVPTFLSHVLNFGLSNHLAYIQYSFKAYIGHSDLLRQLSFSEH